jgi:hypothetical protein
LYESHNGGTAFAGPLFVAPVDEVVFTGVEISRTSSKTVYLAGYARSSRKAALYRSDDGAQSFATPLDLSPELGPREALIAAVDPVDPRIVYLRAAGANADGLAVSLDAGKSATVAFELPVRMTALLLRQDGSLIVGTQSSTVYTSSSPLGPFRAVTGWPRLRGLAERDGVLYAAADDIRDGFAVGASIDGGRSFRPLLHFDRIAGIRGCGTFPEDCATAWAALQVVLAISSTHAADAGAADSGGPPGPVRSSCGSCSNTGPEARLLLLLALSPFLLRRRNRP